MEFWSQAEKKTQCFSPAHSPSPISMALAPKRARSPRNNRDFGETASGYKMLGAGLDRLGLRMCGIPGREIWKTVGSQGLSQGEAGAMGDSHAGVTTDGDARVAQPVKHSTSAQVMISRLVVRAPRRALC